MTKKELARYSARCQRIEGYLALSPPQRRLVLAVIAELSKVATK